MQSRAPLDEIQLASYYGLQMPKAANEKFTIRKVHPVVRCDGLECQVAYMYPGIQWR